MRVLLAFLVMWWIVNLIMAMADRNALAIFFGILYLAACAYGLLARGWFLGLFGWIAIGIGIEAFVYLGSHQHVPATTLLVVLFWCGLAIFAGNRFRSE